MFEQPGRKHIQNRQKRSGQAFIHPFSSSTYRLFSAQIDAAKLHWLKITCKHLLTKYVKTAGCACILTIKEYCPHPNDFELLTAIPFGWMSY